MRLKGILRFKSAFNQNTPDPCLCSAVLHTLSETISHTLFKVWNDGKVWKVEPAAVWHRCCGHGKFSFKLLYIRKDLLLFCFITEAENCEINLADFNLQINTIKDECTTFQTTHLKNYKLKLCSNGVQVQARFEKVLWTFFFIALSVW